jgi:heme/copper-type cytochrome/quinol oxidase subunit 3
MHYNGNSSAAALDAKSPAGSVFKGLSLCIVATLAWQALLLVAAALAASSQTLAAHTRHQQALAGTLWLTGLALNLGGLYWGLRHTAQRTRDGIILGICLLFLLALGAIWLGMVVSGYHAALGDD